MKDDDTYVRHAKIVKACADEIMAKRGGKFVIDSHNKSVLRLLLYYFNDTDINYIRTYFESDADYKGVADKFDLHKNIMLVGDVGTGKTLIMDVFALYLKRTGNPHAYTCTSVTEMLNYYKVHNHLNKYTYNVSKRVKSEAEPLAYCVNDIGLETQKHYGNDLQVVIDEYIHARNEIYCQGVRNHFTTNLTREQMTELLADPFGRLADRLKTYNIVPLTGESRR